MAEVLTTLAILGVVAVITVPSIVNKQALKSKRVKLQKAMAVYDLFINEAINIEGIQRNVEKLDEWGSENSCVNSRKYFKISKNYKDNKGQINYCKFSTSDGVWWDLTKPSKTMVAFKDTDLTVANAESQTSYKAFYFVTRFDNGIIRTVDTNYGMQKADYSMLANSAKVRAFIDQKEITDYYTFCPSSCWSGNCAPSCIRTLGDCYEYYNENAKRLYQVCGCKSKATDCNSYSAFIPGYDENYSRCEYKNQGDTLKSCNYTTMHSQYEIEDNYSGCKENAGETHEGCTQHEHYDYTEYGFNLKTCNLTNNKCSYTKRESKNLPANIKSIDYGSCKSDYETNCKVTIARFQNDKKERTFDLNSCKDATLTKCTGCYARAEKCPPKNSEGYYVIE